MNSNLYWYYDSTCFGQPFCPSSGVLSRTSTLVHFMQIWWPFAIRSRMELQFHPAPAPLHISGSLSAHHQEFLAIHQHWYILCSCDDHLLPGVGWNCSSILLLLFTYFGQPFCPSSGVLRRTSTLVHFMQISWPFPTRSRMELQFHPALSSKRSSQLHKMYQCRCTANNSWWWAERLPETRRVLMPIKIGIQCVCWFHSQGLHRHLYLELCSRGSRRYHSLSELPVGT